MPRRARSIVLAVALAAAALVPAARADDAAVVSALNEPMRVVPEDIKSWRVLAEAAAAMTEPPAAVDALAVWPGMDGWEGVKAWAAANPGMAEAIMTAQKRRIFGLPYGAQSVPAGLADKGFFVGIGDGLRVIDSDPRYLKVLDVVLAYVSAEMYRLGEAKEFDRAFDLGIGMLRVLRHVADQHLLAEKTWAMSRMCDLCSIQRDVAQAYLDAVPAATFRRMAISGFAAVNPADAERLRRLDMPEGDRVLAEAMIFKLFDARGQPDPAKFAETMGQLQARDEPLASFGAARRWSELARIHGSLDLTLKSLTNIYDDWWRRWRMGYYEPKLGDPTVISRTNKARYAMVLLMVKDIERAFALRQRLNAELNGSVLAFGLAAYYRETGSWPRELKVTYNVGRFDRDPWNPKWGEGTGALARWEYQLLTTPRPIECEAGRVQLSGGVIYSLGQDKADGRAERASDDGKLGDLVVWPALRALARSQGIVK
jgi:hypothetical protein